MQKDDTIVTVYSGISTNSRRPKLRFLKPLARLVKANRKGAPPPAVNEKGWCLGVLQLLLPRSNPIPSARSRSNASSKSSLRPLSSAEISALFFQSDTVGATATTTTTATTTATANTATTAATATTVATTSTAPTTTTAATAATSVPAAAASPTCDGSEAQKPGICKDSSLPEIHMSNEPFEPDTIAGEPIEDGGPGQGSNASVAGSDPYLAPTAQQGTPEYWEQIRNQWTQGTHIHTTTAEEFENFEQSQIAHVPESSYPHIYRMMVKENRLLKHPLNLMDAIKLITAGWVSDGTWKKE